MRLTIWVYLHCSSHSELRKSYIGVYFSRFRRFKCSIDHAIKIKINRSRSIDQVFKCFVVVDDMLFCIVTFNLWLHYNKLLTYLLTYAKRLFYKAANSVFSKIGRIASEEVTLQLVKRISHHGLEVCKLNSQMASLDFTINRFL